MLESMIRVYLILSALVLGAPSARALCTGDCDGNNAVVVSELVRSVSIALGFQPVAGCLAVDTNNSGSVAINELVAAVGSALNGCPALPTPTATPDGTPTVGIEPIFPADYRDSFVEVRDCRLAIEHGGVMIRVYANPIGAQPYIENANPLPEGSIVIKEEFNGVDCSNDAELVRWAAMRKEAPGFDPEDADWRWQRVNAPSRAVECEGKLCPTFPCLGCHSAQSCLDRDYMCTEGEAPRGRLRKVLQDLPGALLSISGRSPTDVYAVGTDQSDGQGPLVLHYNGTQWRRLDTEASGDLWWISVTPIDGDFYLAGDGGLILQLDPDSNTFTRHTTPGTQRMFGIWGSSATNLWAVGEDPNNTDSGGVVWHYDGKMWTVENLPNVRGGVLPGLLKIWGRNAGEIYAVGRRALAIRFDGGGWSELTVNGIPETRTLFTVHGNDTITAASGGFFAEGAILELVGTGFAGRTPDGAPQQNGIFIPPDGRAVAVGNGLSTAIRTDTGWELKTEGEDPLRDYHTAWVDPDGAIWAVGGDLADEIDGVVAYGGTQDVPGEVTP
jgi:hypothetical protein